MRESELLWQKLHGEGLVQGQYPSTPQSSAADTLTPWFINLLLGLCGWLAAFFLLGFVATVFSGVLNQPAVCLVLGVCLLGLAFVMLRRGQQTFGAHLALALSLAGQGLVAWGCIKLAAPQSVVLWWGGALFQALLVVIMPHAVHRALSAFAATLCVAVGMDGLGLALLYPPSVLIVVALLWLNELNIHDDVSRVTMPAWGVSLALLLMLFVRRFEHTAYGWFDPAAALAGLPPWLGEALCAFVMLLVFAVLLRRSGMRIGSRAWLISLAGGALIGLFTVFASGLSSVLTLVILGFALANRVLFGLGVVAGLIFLSSYYYLLSISLLHKAIVLLLLGLVMLGLRVVLTRRGAP